MPLIARPMLLCCIAATLILAAKLGVSQTQSLHAIDLQGHEIDRLVTAGARVVVLIFAATDCPISNRYIPEVARLDREFAGQEAVIWWVFPNPGDSLAVVQKHAHDFSITTPTLIDSRQDLMHMANVAVTPEAAVFAVKDGNLHEVYHGRIDDRYIAFGQERPQATRHELQEAIEATLEGRSVPKSSGGPVGCSIIPIALKP
jgi:AhpC/TSA family